MISLRFMSLRVYASLRRQPAQAAVGFVAQTPCIGLRRGGDVGGGGPRVHDPPPFFCLAIYKNEANGRFQHSTPKDGPRPQATGIPTSPVWPDPLHSEPHQYGRTVSLVQPYLPPGELSHEDQWPFLQSWTQGRIPQEQAEALTGNILG